MAWGVTRKRAGAPLDLRGEGWGDAEVARMYAERLAMTPLLPWERAFGHGAPVPVAG
jgi:hypothetical protein